MCSFSCISIFILFFMIQGHVLTRQYRFFFFFFAQYLLRCTRAYSNVAFLLVHTRFILRGNLNRRVFFARWSQSSNTISMTVPTHNFFLIFLRFNLILFPGKLSLFCQFRNSIIMKKYYIFFFGPKNSMMAYFYFLA